MKEILVSVLLLALVVLLLNPFGFWMPNTIHIMLLGASLAAFGALAVFVIRERVGDEREILHRGIAGRVAFLAGAAILLAAVGVQSFNHAVDPWIVVALGGMVLAKLATRLYADRFL